MSYFTLIFFISSAYWLRKFSICREKKNKNILCVRAKDRNLNNNSCFLMETIANGYIFVLIKLSYRFDRKPFSNNIETHSISINLSLITIFLFRFHGFCNFNIDNFTKSCTTMYENISIIHGFTEVLNSFYNYLSSTKICYLNRKKDFQQIITTRNFLIMNHYIP